MNLAFSFLSVNFVFKRCHINKFYYFNKLLRGNLVSYVVSEQLPPLSFPSCQMVLFVKASRLHKTLVICVLRHLSLLTLQLKLAKDPFHISVTLVSHLYPPGKGNSFMLIVNPVEGHIIIHTTIFTRQFQLLKSSCQCIHLTEV